MDEQQPPDETPHRPETEIIFSLEGGYVSASWPDTGVSVRLGTYATITAMMTDFLAQCAVAERLKGAGSGICSQ